MTDTDMQTVQMNPKAPAVRFIVNQMGQFVNDECPSQIVADVAMALMIIAEIEGVDHADLVSLMKAGQENAAAVAEYLCKSVIEEASHG